MLERRSMIVHNLQIPVLAASPCGIGPVNLLFLTTRLSTRV